MAYTDSYYVLSLNILKALGGDVTVNYPDADAIWDEIYKIYDHSGGRFDIVPLEKTITENGQYDFYPDNNADAFMPVNLTIEVPQKYTDEQVTEIENAAREDGYNTGYSSGFVQGETEGYNDGYSEGLDEGYSDGVIAQKEKLESTTITENGTYTKEDGWNEVIVEVEAGIPEEELQQMLQEAMDEGYQDGYAEGVDDGFVDGVEDQKSKLESTTFRDNGTYTKEDGWNEVTVQVDVPTFETETLSVELKSNGNYNYTPTKDGYSLVSVRVDVDASGGDTKPKIYNGFKLLANTSANTPGSLLADVDFTQYDWSDVYDLAEFFMGFYYTSDSKWSDSAFDNFRVGFNGEIVGMYRAFIGSGQTDSSSPLIEVPDFSKFTNNLVDLTEAFYWCGRLTNATNIAAWNTSNVVSTTSMFYGCKELVTVPLFDTSNVVTMDSMFGGCKRLYETPQFDTSHAISVSNMFANCSLLQAIPSLNTQQVVYMSYMCNNCTTLKTVGTLYCDNVNNINYMFNSCSSLTDVGGLINLGASPTLTTTSMFSGCNNLTHDAIMNIINSLYDRAAAGFSVVNLPLGSTNLGRISDEEKAIATNKGWSLS